MGVRLGTRDVQAPPRPAKTRGFPIDRVVPGEVRPTAYGETFLCANHYPLEYQHGAAPIAVSCSLERLFEWGGSRLPEGLDLNNVVFLDTETTGLAGGTGTYAFMVGIGHFDSSGFLLEQFFMRDPAEESAVLAGLLTAMDPTQVLVTFNGKSFDAPLLNTRYTLQGLSSPLPALIHLDLLPLARRLWRDRLPSRALSYLEVSILRAYRTQEEVPGWLIPQLYFDYLHSGDARPLAGVFYHNQMDILALAALFAHTARMLDDPLGGSVEEGQDRLALARLYEDLGRTDDAIRIYRKGLEQGLPEEAFWDGMGRLALLHRRLGDWLSAVDLWRKAAERGHLEACVELAKYYEHRQRDYPEALRWTEAGLAIAGDARRFPPYQRKQALDQLGHRMERCKRKLERYEVDEVEAEE
jgi:uncharacterized protein YprB with RNaseH-like and TPR domain